MLLPTGPYCRGACTMTVPPNASIVEHFQTLEDPRIERTKKHLLLDILVIAVCTLLTGGEGFQDMELFGKSKHAWLQTFLAQFLAVCRNVKTFVNMRESPTRCRT